MNLEQVVFEFIDYDKKNSSNNLDTSLYYLMDHLMSCINSNPNIIEPYNQPESYALQRSAALVPLIFNFFIC